MWAMQLVLVPFANDHTSILGTTTSIDTNFHVCVFYFNTEAIITKGVQKILT